MDSDSVIFSVEWNYASQEVVCGFIVHSANVHCTNVQWRGKHLNTLAWLVRLSAVKLYHKHGS